jgi:flagellar basal-body rod protein FlgC
MPDALKTSIVISSSGLAAQSQRMRIVSENIANANTTGRTPGSEPYQRKTVSFIAELDRESGVSTVKLDKFGVDPAPFTLVHDPGHVAADKNGMVKLPNVEMLLEMADMRETIRSYEANMQAAKQARNLISMTIDMIGG